MDFITFVVSIEKHEDPDILIFAKALKKIEGLPSSSDPRMLGRYLYRKLNKQQTFGFQKCFLQYKAVNKTNEIPEELKDETTFLQAINLIEMLQNSDPDYK